MLLLVKDDSQHKKHSHSGMQLMSSISKKNWYLVMIIIALTLKHRLIIGFNVAMSPLRCNTSSISPDTKYETQSVFSPAI